MPDPWLDAALDPTARVEAFTSELTRADLEAIALGDFSPLETRGLPGPDYVDAGTGLRGVDGATAFPCGIALAASFDPGLAHEYGAAVATEARRAGFPVVLGPTVDLARDPEGGRVAEAFGEDPHLASLIGAAHVAGLQSRHVIAQVKHFVAYNGESRRTGHGREDDRGDAVDVLVDDAALHDVYLRPFEAAVRAGAWSLMGSYNRINGRYVCESAEILDIPRRHWGWAGFYCPDFIFAVRDPAAALAAGLDLGALGGAGGRTPDLVAAAPDGLLRAIAQRLAAALIGSGLADHPLLKEAPPSDAGHLALAKRVVEAGAVLLTNDALLPLAADVRRVALIGPAGHDALFVGGGAASVTLSPERLVTPEAAIEAALAPRGIDLVRAQGSLGDVALPVVPSSAFLLPDGSGPGVEVLVDGAREVWHDIDHAVDPADPGRRWPSNFRTRLIPEATGPHRLSLTFGGTARLRIDGVEVLAASREAERFIHGPLYPAQAVVDLRAGVPVAVEIDYDHGPAIAIPPMGLGPTIRLGWQPPDDRIDGAVAAAEACDVAIVVVNAAAGEGMDRDSLALPGDQDELVRRVAAANPRTLVVLNTPGAVLTPWRDDVAAILAMWYPGEAFGPALADLLLGITEPGGRLPLTFPLERAHLPGARRPGEVPQRLDYCADDGIGYRSAGVREHGAAFAFGHGLGYGSTTATLTSTLRRGDRLDLQIAVTNDGDRDAVHVVQVYAHLGGTEPRELVAVRRVAVAAGATQQCAVGIDAGALSRWDASAARRAPVPGTHLLRVARDSADAGEMASLTVA